MSETDETREENLEGFEDPLFSRGKKAPRSAKQARSGANSTVVISLVVLAGALSFLGYYLFQAQQQIEGLSADLTVSQDGLAEVSQELVNSQGKIGNLEEGLVQSESNLQAQDREITRYKGLYSEMKSDQEQQSLELEAVALTKADQSVVDSLRGDTENLRETAEKINERVSQTQSDVSQLRDMSTQNRDAIEGNQQELSSLAESTESTNTDLAQFKKSFATERHNFELQEKGNIRKIANVSFRLRDVNEKRQRYDLEIYTAGRKIRRKNQYLNEPIYFYVGNFEKPYEVVITSIGKKLAAGYLSIPKN